MRNFGMKIPVREIMTITFSYRDNPKVEEEITLWDTECEQWLKDNAYKCRNLKVEPMAWEEHVNDFSSGALISFIKKPKDKTSIKE